jgi:hypothetical protein
VVSALTGRRMGDLSIPITIVPGAMTKEQILAVT